IIAFPFSFGYLAWIHGQGTDGAFSLSVPMMLVLMFSGVATAMPLYLFGLATQRLPLSTVGFIQYLSPTTSLLLAVLVFHESFTT
ncbi:EamA family transporter, partial [Microbacteriaceae bacterium K1510]|nr:EamA family transporter [Microbacteriaceae bacterium K1510]